MMNEKKMKIDFVVTWVDESDPEWIKQKKMYGKYDDILNSEARYRNWEFLKYWFRSIEKNAPWVHKVFFITAGHVPSWLNQDYKKVTVVKHTDYIDDEYLPTFNSNVIELNVSNITGLSEHFVSFNDDMFLNGKVSKQDFFKNGSPRDMGVFSPIIPDYGGISSTVLNNVTIINKYFSKKKVINKNPLKFFNVRYGKHIVKNVCTLPWSQVLGFYDNHIPISYKKSTFEKVWRIEKSDLTKTLTHRFRKSSDLSHWLMRYWQICEGDFLPRSTRFGQYYTAGPDDNRIINDIRESRHKVICVNDSDELRDFNKTKSLINEEFKKKYGEKSKFEK